jgi:DNA modification methylase
LYRRLYKVQVSKIPIGQLNPAAYNPRKDLQPGDPEYEKLKRSIQEFGYVEPIVWNERTGNIVGGHQRYKVLLDMGMSEVDCVVVDLDDAKEKALNLALNKIQGDWDYLKLKDLLQELDTGEFDIELTGFDIGEIEDLMTQFHVPGEIIEDEVPEPPEEPITKPGDLWILGRHRLLCGDATVITDVERLMDGKKADMVFTDPPYNVNYGDKASMLNDYQKGHRNTSSIKNDNMKKDDFLRFLIDSFKSIYVALCPGGAFYICHAESTGLEFRKAALEAGFLLKQCIIWAKNSLVIGRQDYQWKHEPILYGWKPGAAHRWYGGRKNTTVIEDNAQVVIEKQDDHAIIHLSLGLQQLAIKVSDYEVIFDGDDSLTTVWRIEKPQRNDVHPTMKPVSLCARAIGNSSKPGEIVLDVFGGSGSTLIAAEQLNRTCYMMELDPIYCDVIIKRWENFTGQKAVIAE